MHASYCVYICVCVWASPSGRQQPPEPRSCWQSGPAGWLDNSAVLHQQTRSRRRQVTAASDPQDLVIIRRRFARLQSYYVFTIIEKATYTICNKSICTIHTKFLLPLQDVCNSCFNATFSTVSICRREWREYVSVVVRWGRNVTLLLKCTLCLTLY